MELAMKSMAREVGVRQTAKKVDPLHRESEKTLPRR